MRWPLRRRRPAAGQAATAVPPELARRGGRGEWRRLAPPTLTTSRRPPILHDGLVSLPDVAGTRPLLPSAPGIGELPSPWATRPPSDASELVHATTVGWPSEHAGRPSLLQGADGVIRAADDDPARSAEAAQERAGTGPGQVPGVPVRVAPVVGSPASARQLTRATDEYVGEAREPATPYKSSEWLRKVSSMKPPWLADSDEEIAPLAPPPEPAPGMPPRGTSRPLPRAGRAGLGASRRLNLGPPQQGSGSGSAGGESGRDGEPGNAARGSTAQDIGGPAPAGAAGRQAGSGAGASHGKPREGPSPARQQRRAGGPPGSSPRAPIPAPPGAVTATSALAPAADARSGHAPDPGQAPAPAGEGPLPGIHVPASAGPAAAPGDESAPLGSQSALADRQAAVPDSGPLPPAGRAGPAGPRAQATPATSGAPAREQPGHGDSAPALTHRPDRESEQARWWRRNEPERSSERGRPAAAGPPRGEQVRAADGPLPAGPGTAGRASGTAAAGTGRIGRRGDPAQAGNAGTGPASTEMARGSADLPPLPHVQARTVPGRDGGRPASEDSPELILAPPAGQAPRADTTQASAEPSPAAALDAGLPGLPGPPGQSPPDAAQEAGRDRPSDSDRRGAAVWQADDIGYHPDAPDAETTEAPVRQAAREPGQRAPAQARYRSALDPLLPAPMPAAPSRRDATFRVAVTTPSAPAAHVAQAARRGAPGRPSRQYQSAADGIAAERVPASLASAFRALHGADVSDVPVRRGRAVSTQATRLDAAAFSHGGVVYLPDSAGSLSQMQAQALLAHELTHAVQQRMLGAALPGEASAEGRELEEQAMATQRWFLGAAGPVPPLAFLPSATAAPLTHAPAVRPALPAAPDEPDGVFAADSAGASWSSWAPGVPGMPGVHGSAGQVGVQRQPAEAAPLATTPSPGSAAADGAAPAPDVTAAVADAHSGLADLRGQVAELAGQRSAVPDDPVDLDELAAKLYRRLRSKLRLELIVDRERAGLLTDFR